MSPAFCIPDHPIFRDRDVLESDYVPEEFPFRDSQLEEIAYCLQPCLAGSRPLNAVLRGIPGTGKTTSVKRIFAEAAVATKRVLPVYVNCQAERTLFSILSRVHSRIYGHVPPALGSPARTVLDRVGRGLVDRKLVLAVCLDDANYLLADRLLNSVLYTLLRLHETYPGVRSGVLLAVSDMDIDFHQALDPCVMSVLSPTEISFPPYTWDEVHSILQDRVRRALYPGVLPGELLDLVVDRAMSCGDLRVGIDLVRRASLGAERAGQKKVTRENIETAFESSRDVYLGSCVKALSKEEQDLLEHIARVTLEDPERPITTGTLFGSVQGQVSYTVFHQRIKKLDEMRLIDVNHKNAGKGGRTREILLRYDPVTVMEACE